MCIITAVKPTNNFPFILKGNEETFKKLQQKPSKEMLEESKQNAKIAKEIFTIKKKLNKIIVIKRGLIILQYCRPLFKRKNKEKI